MALKFKITLILKLSNQQVNVSKLVKITFITFYHTENQSRFLLFYSRRLPFSVQFKKKGLTLTSSRLERRGSGLILAGGIVMAFPCSPFCKLLPEVSVWSGGSLTGVPSEFKEAFLTVPTTVRAFTFVKDILIVNEYCFLLPI